jgi:hypothetical protein
VRINIDFSELAKLAGDIAADVAMVDGSVQPAVGRATDRLHARAVNDAPRDTGELKGAIAKDSWGLARRVYAPVRQAFYQEYGTSFHPPQPFLMVHADRAHVDLEQEITKAKWGLSRG